jgi:hypothetical protein
MKAINERILGIILMLIGFYLWFSGPVVDLNHIIISVCRVFLYLFMVIIGLSLLLEPKKPLSKSESYYCEKCKGTSTTSNQCENPYCPNMPCCGDPEDKCECKDTPYDN